MEKDLTKGSWVTVAKDIFSDDQHIHKGVIGRVLGYDGLLIVADFSGNRVAIRPSDLVSLNKLQISSAGNSVIETLETFEKVKKGDAPTLHMRQCERLLRAAHKDLKSTYSEAANEISLALEHLKCYFSDPRCYILAPEYFYTHLGRAILCMLGIGKREKLPEGAPAEEALPESCGEVLITLGLTLEEFDESVQQTLVRGLAKRLGISRKTIAVGQIRKGSVEVVLTFKSLAALARFLNMYSTKDPELGRFFIEREVLGVQVRPATLELPVQLTPKIGIISALPEEFVAVKVMIPSGIPYNISRRGACWSYWLGNVPSCQGGSHSVVVCRCGVGNNIAASRATVLLEHFSTVESIMMVGIAGGVPNPDNAEHHVRLGDVVVSDEKGVIQYDFDKETADFVEIRATPMPPSARLLEGVHELKVNELEGQRPWEDLIRQGLRQLRWRRPAKTTDILSHTRNPNQRVSHPKDVVRHGVWPRVFLGPIASANKLLQNPAKRDMLRDRFGVKAVEMEASGIADATWRHATGYLVIRGICDYCDSNKGDEWQKYAAIVAAGYTRALLESMPV